MDSRTAPRETHWLMAKKVAATKKTWLDGPPALGVSIAILVVLALVAYGNVFSHGWVFDDYPAVLRNKAYELTWRNFVRVWLQPRPVTDMTFLANRLVSGDQPSSYHFVNVVIHMASGIALLGLMRRTPGGERLALPTAALFIVHPLQTESVTYIAQRTQALMGFFEFLSFYCVARSQEGPNRGRWHAGAVVTFMLGMLTKPHMVLEPLLVLLYERAFFAPSFKDALKRSPRLYGALCASWVLGAAYVIQRLVRHNWEDVGAGGRTPLNYLAAQAFVIPFYIWLTVFPKTLCIDYYWAAVPVPYEVLGALVTLTLIGATVYAWLRSPPLGFLGAWFFLNLFPSSGVIPRVDLVVEHRMYVPLAAVIVALLVPWLRGPSNFVFASLSFVTFILIARTHVRNEDYRTNFAIWSSAAAVSPKNARAHHNLATEFKLAGDHARAFHEYQRALESDPDYRQSWLDRGELKARLGRYSEAIPDFTEAMLDPRITAVAHYNRGNSKRALGLKEAALDDYSRAIEARAKEPKAEPFLEAIYNRGAVHVELNAHDKAVADFTSAIAIRPDLVTAHRNRGIVHLRMGRLPEARADLDNAIRLEPSNPQHYFDRALVSGDQKRFDEAWADVRRGRSLGGTPSPEFMAALRSVSGRSE
jgi:protein O-mannosyl-transferase